MRVFSNPAGNGVEIELPNSETLAEIEEDVKRLQTLDAQLKELELNATTLTAQNEQTPSDSLIQQVRETASKQTGLNAEILASSQAVLSKMALQAAVPNDAHEAVKIVVREYGRLQDNYRASILAAVQKVVPVKSHSFREVGPSLSRFFLQKARDILLYSFILAGIVVFIVFRSFTPSLVVITGAVADILITAGAMALFDIPLTLASIAGLLMLIGFSLDTDVMLTMRVLKRNEGTPQSRAHDALKTGLMMNLTSIGAFGVLALTGLYLQIPTYYQIGIVAVIGSIADVAATWGLNAVLVLRHVEKKTGITQPRGGS